MRSRRSRLRHGGDSSGRRALPHAEVLIRLLTRFLFRDVARQHQSGGLRAVMRIPEAGEVVTRDALHGSAGAHGGIAIRRVSVERLHGHAQCRSNRLVRLLQDGGQLLLAHAIDFLRCEGRMLGHLRKQIERCVRRIAQRVDGCSRVVDHRLRFKLRAKVICRVCNLRCGAVACSFGQHARGEAGQAGLLRGIGIATGQSDDTRVEDRERVIFDQIHMQAVVQREDFGDGQVRLRQRSR